MIRLPSLERLAKGLRTAPHDFRPSLQVFPDVSVEALARELSVEKRGAETGQRNEPTSASVSLDAVENEIVERIYSERKSAYQDLIDQLETYSQRLGALDFAGRFATIQHAAPAAVSEFKTEAGQGRNQLYQLRRTLVENENERDNFRDQHGLKRAPRVSTGISTFFKIAFLFFLFVVETYANGIFLAKGNELGFLGGVAESLAFAILNVVVSFYLGLLGARQVNYTGFFWKVVGLLSILFWLAFAILLNLALAHYREISGTIISDAGALVIQRMINNTFELKDIISWLFFALGALSR